MRIAITNRAALRKGEREPDRSTVINQEEYARHSFRLYRDERLLETRFYKVSIDWM
jgi:hypothetical protein